MRVQREGQDLAGGRFRDREVSLAISVPPERGLQVHGHRIVDGDLDPLLLEMAHHVVTPGYLDHIQVPYMLVARRGARQRRLVYISEKVVVPGRGGSTAFIPACEAAQLCP